MADLPTNWVDNIGMIEDAAFLNLVGTNVNANTAARPKSGLYSALPAAGKSGLLYFATDAGIVLRDNGTSWDIVGGSGNPAFTAPPTTGWSTTTLGSATVAADKGGRLFTLPNSDTTPRIEHRTLSPTSNYTFTCRVDFATRTDNVDFGGIFLRESSTSNIVFFGSLFDGSNPYILTSKGSSTNIRTTDYGFKQITLVPYGMPNWWRIRDDGTNRICEYSYNGLDWIQHHSVGRTDYITPNQIGWGGANNGATSATAYARLRSFSVA